MAATLLNHFKQGIKDLTLVPSSGGCFEVKYDHDLVWSKLKTKEFPLEEAMVSLAKKRLHA